MDIKSQLARKIADTVGQRRPEKTWTENLTSDLRQQRDDMKALLHTSMEGRTRAIKEANRFQFQRDALLTALQRCLDEDASESGVSVEAIKQARDLINSISGA